MSVVLLVYSKQCYAAGRSADITKGADKHLTLDLGYVTPKALNSVPRQFLVVFACGTSEGYCRSIECRMWNFSV